MTDERRSSCSLLCRCTGHFSFWFDPIWFILMNSCGEREQRTNHSLFGKWSTPSVNLELKRIKLKIGFDVDFFSFSNSWSPRSFCPRLFFSFFFFVYAFPRIIRFLCANISPEVRITKPVDMIETAVMPQLPDISVYTCEYACIFLSMNNCWDVTAVESEISSFINRYK